MGLFPGSRAQAATPTDVFRQVVQIQHTLEAIRQELDLPRHERSLFPAENATPREVFTQAESLQVKIRNLLEEQARKHEPLLILKPEGKITPDLVLQVVDYTRAMTRMLADHLKIKVTVPKPVTQKKTPTDVFQAMIQVNRQANLMLKTRVNPSDVFLRVAESIQYMDAVWMRLDPKGFEELPLPVLDPSRKPADVYNQLLRCLRIQSEVLRLSGLKMMQLDRDYSAPAGTIPGDVYDLASLMFSEVLPLHASLPDPPLTPGAYYPGPKGPSEVFQQAKALEGRLWRVFKFLRSERP
ncbi:MAG: hypothetical protein HQL53_02465 [Magnetococcales bacterium]|nr:hypothetical protein [Magnetococcales bacterium]